MIFDGEYKQTKTRNNMNVTDTEETYDAQIAPLIAQILKVCVQNKMPFFAKTFFHREGLPMSVVSVVPGGSDHWPQPIRDLIAVGRPDLLRRNDPVVATNNVSG